MFRHGDICEVIEHPTKPLRGILQSIVGKDVIIVGSEPILERYSVRVLSPEESCPWEKSEQLMLREELLRLKG